MFKTFFIIFLWQVCLLSACGSVSVHQTKETGTKTNQGNIVDNTKTTKKVKLESTNMTHTVSTEIEKPPHTKAIYTINISAKGYSYYHLMFTLSADNMLDIQPMTQATFIENGGQFELSIRKSAFPISAPHCQGHIILRMPWVSSKIDVSQKFQLYTQLRRIADTKQGSLNVAIELNPYVEVNKEGLQLQQCNVFFRHANHHYIPHVQSIN